MKRLQIHPSMLSTYTDCGEAFNRKYIGGERSSGEASEFLVVGKALDAAVNADLYSKLRHGTLLGDAEMIELAATVVRRSDLEPDLRAKSLDRAVALARYAHIKVTPRIEVKSIQRHWSIRLDEAFEKRGFGMVADYVGALDVEEYVYNLINIAEPGTGVLDLKTSRISPPANAAQGKHWIQLTSYVLGLYVLDHVMPVSVKIKTLVSAKTGVDCKTSVGDANFEDFGPLLERLYQFAHSWQTGNFHPASPASWKCTADWCEFYSTCRFTRKPVTVPVGKLLQIQPVPTDNPLDLPLSV